MMSKKQHVKFVLTLTLTINPRGESGEVVQKELEGV
jgi:hypothetical protein